MFDAWRTGAARAGRASQRLKSLVASVRAGEPEWIDENQSSAPEQPPPREPGRFAGRRWQVVLGAAVVVATCVVIALVVAAPGKELPPPLPDAVASAPAKAPAAIVVSVVGKVANPGLITLPDGARVADAVRVAGGVSDADALGLNLARRLTDGEQIYVGIPAPPEIAPPVPTKPAKVDLNTAGVAQLDGLPGVGAVTAQRIIDWRTEHGRFTSVEQLRQIDGIGDSRFARLKDLVVVR